MGDFPLVLAWVSRGFPLGFPWYFALKCLQIHYLHLQYTSLPPVLNVKICKFLGVGENTQETWGKLSGNLGWNYRKIGVGDFFVCY